MLRDTRAHARTQVRGIIEVGVFTWCNSWIIWNTFIVSQSRRWNIVSPSRTDFSNTWWIEIHGRGEKSTAKRLMEEQRTTAFYEKPRALLRREEQRQAVKSLFVTWSRRFWSEYVFVFRCVECALIHTQIRPYVRFIVWIVRSLLRYL